MLFVPVFLLHALGFGCFKHTSETSTYRGVSKTLIRTPKKHLVEIFLTCAISVPFEEYSPKTVYLFFLVINLIAII